LPTATAIADVDHEQALRDRLAEFRWDPLGAVLYGFPWGEGELARFKEPRKWQCEELERLGAWLQNPETRHRVYRRAISSGHGPGKTTLGAFLCWWAQSTFLDSMARVTANTETQLTKTTQPEYSRWFRLAINAHWFDVNTTSIKANDDGCVQTWRLDLVPWSLENSQAFAGKHNAGRRMLFLFEEASPIPQEIFRVTNGALTDEGTERIFFCIGNPTLNTGPFYEAVFGTQRDRWSQPELLGARFDAGPRVIDSRDVEGADLEEINGWLAECGGDEDADYFRVRARGLFPKGAEGQFIDLATISKAQSRAVRALPDDPLIAGVDFAWGGADDNVIRFRKGNDARSIPPIKVKGEFTRNPAVMADKIADVLTQHYHGEQVAMAFVDGSGVGGNAGAVVARVRMAGFKNIIEVNFGHDALDSKHYVYRRDEMWGKMRTWLRDSGAIDKDPGLSADLAKPMLVSDTEQRIKLESKELMKKRLQKLGVDSGSPDDADALALTFAMPVAPRKPKRERGSIARGYTPWS
jgi:hypothetical protein